MKRIPEEDLLTQGAKGTKNYFSSMLFRDGLILFKIQTVLEAEEGRRRHLENIAYLGFNHLDLVVATASCCSDN
jgi:hypothetical protein